MALNIQRPSGGNVASAGVLTTNFMLRGAGGNDIEIAGDGVAGILTNTAATQLNIRPVAGGTISFGLLDSGGLDQLNFGFNDTSGDSNLTATGLLNISAGGDIDITLPTINDVVRLKRGNFLPENTSNVGNVTSQSLGSTSSRWKSLNVGSTVDYLDNLEFTSQDGTFLKFNTEPGNANIDIFSPIVTTGRAQLNLLDVDDEITSVGNNGGNAVFNHAGRQTKVGATVKIINFENETDYNVTGIVSATTDSPRSFEVSGVLFTDTDTGSFSEVQASLTFDEGTGFVDLVSIGDIGMSVTNAGSLGIQQIGGGNTDKVFVLTNTLGTFGAEVDFYVGNVPPVGAVDGFPGDHFLLSDAGTASGEFIHKGSGPDNTSWEQEITTADTLTDLFVVMGAGGSSLQSADGDVPGIIRLRSQDGMIIEAQDGDLNLQGSNSIDMISPQVVLRASEIGGEQTYTFSHTGDVLNWQSGDPANDFDLNIFTLDGDGTDDLGFTFYRVGTPGSVANSESLFIGTIGNDWHIRTDETGTGLPRNLIIDADSIDLNAASTVNLFSTSGSVAINEFTTIDADGHVFDVAADTAGLARMTLTDSIAAEQFFMQYDDSSNLVSMGAVDKLDIAVVDAFRILDNNSFNDLRSGLTIRQLGIADAVLHLSVLAQDWSIGIDNSQSNNFCIDTGTSLSTTAPFQIDPITKFVGINTDDTPDSVLHARSTTSHLTPVFTLEVSGANGAQVQDFVSVRDPNGLVTGVGGDALRRGDGELSGSYESLALTSATEWHKRSILPPNVKEIHNAAELAAFAVGTLITITEDTTFLVYSDFTSDIEIECTTGNLNIHFMFTNATWTHSSAGTFMTADAGVNIRFFGRARISFQTFSGTFINYKGTGPNRGVEMRNTTVAFCQDLGTIQDGFFLYSDVNFAQYGAPLKLIDVNVSSDGLNAVAGGRVFEISHVQGGLGSQFNVQRLSGGIITTAPLVRIDPFVGDDSQLLFTNTAITTPDELLFDTAGTSKAWGLVVDRSLSGINITSVDSGTGGTARFHRGGSGKVPEEGEVVINVGFTEPLYNVSGVVTDQFFEDWYELDIPFQGVTDTGSFSTNTIQLFTVTHNLSGGQTIYMVTDESSVYDGGNTVIDIGNNDAFFVTAVFAGDLSGVWSTRGLDHTNPQVLSFQSIEGSNSHYIATSFVNDNTEPNQVITNGVFTDMTFGPNANNSLIAGSTMERWKLIDPVIGLHEYIGEEPFDGKVTPDATSISSGGAQDFIYKLFHTIDATITATTISFVAIGATIEDSANGFLAAGFVAEDNITVTDSALNNFDFKIESVTGGVMTLSAEDILVAELAGANVTIAGTFGSLPEEAKSSIGNTAVSVSKTFGLFALKGDRIKQQITRVAGNSSIIHQNWSLYADM